MSLAQLRLIKNTLMFLVVLFAAGAASVTVYNYINSEGQQIFGMVNIILFLLCIPVFVVFLYMRGKIKEKRYLKEHSLQ